MTRGIFLIIFLILISNRGSAQDTQYSQFYAYPVYMNAALSGSHSGTYRVSSAYRSQWAQSLDRPFTSFSMAGDFKIETAPNKKSSDFAGAGLIFSSDQIGVFNYDVYQIALMGAYHKLLSVRSNTYLSAGIHFGLGQRSINYNSVSFEDQFNGQDGYTFATQELLPANNFAHPDLGFGLNFSTTPSKNLGVYIGGSYYHLNEPNISFYAKDVDVEVPQENARLNRRLTVHAAASIPITDLITVLPRAIYNGQGQHTSVTFGANLRLQLVEAEASFFHLGTWARSTKSLSVFQPTDATLYAGFEVRGLMLGLSYDIYLREIAGQVGTGTFEFTISFTGSHENSAQICPSF